MADLTVTAANVSQTDGGYRIGTAGETLTAGVPVYLKSSDQRYWKTDADASAEAATCAGIAMCGAAAGQQFVIATDGNIGFGAILTKGEAYYCSDTAGMIMPVGDLDSGDYRSYIGTATTTSNLLMRIHNTGTTA